VLRQQGGSRPGAAPGAWWNRLKPRNRRGDGDDETDEFKLDAAAAAAEEAVERKEVRRVKPWLSWTCWSGRSWQGTGWVEEDVEEHQDTNIACVVGIGQKMDRAQDTTLTSQGAMRSGRETRVVAYATRGPRCI
jgi:hypothetical protein